MAKNEQTLLQLHIERPLYEQEALNEEYNYEKPKAFSCRDIVKAAKEKRWKSCISSMLPAIGWLRRYKFKQSITFDMMSGLTVAIMHIPQGMAYALLGNLPPVVGLYMAFFPVLVYFLFGTSRHVSMGTFAVVCFMTGKVVATHSYPSNAYDGTSANTNISDLGSDHLKPEISEYTPIEVATAVTLIVGIFQIIMYIFRLGVISTLLSDTLVNSFTTAAAVYVLVSQIKDLLGLNLSSHKGYFKLIYTVIDICKEVPNTNIPAGITSLIAIIIMLLNNEILKPWASKKCNIPVPIELIVVVTGTLVSKYCNLSGNYNIKTVGNIPTGIPTPQMPAFDLLPSIVVDGIAITMVSYTITMSMALIFANKNGYEVNSNQELFAMGISNVVGSFFSCMPVSASLSRSLIQEAVGGRTQITSVVSSLVLLCILLWIGPFFEPLPRCVLASIIVVALKGMFAQAVQLKKFWKLSKPDGIIWIVTFFIVVLVNIDIGLLAGLLTSLAIVLLQSIKPDMCLLGHIPHSDLYLDLKRYKATVEIPGIKIFHYRGSLNFVNSAQFKYEMYKLININPKKILKRRKQFATNGLYTDEINAADEIHYIIMDLSAMSYIDPTGVNVLHSIVSEYSLIDVQFYLANCPSSVFERIKKCDFYVYGKLSFRIFVTIPDAVAYVKRELQYQK